MSKYTTFISKAGRPSMVAAVLIAMSVGASACKKPGASQAKSGSVAALTTPESVVVVGGMDSPKQVIDRSQKAGAGFLPLSQQTILAGMQRALLLKDTKAINLDGPMRFAVVDPKNLRDKAPVVILSITNRKAFVASLPNSSKNAQGNELKVQLKRGPAAYLNFINDKAVAVTFEPTLYGKHKAFFAGLLKAKMQSPAGVEIKIARLRKQFAEQLDRSISRLERQMSGGPIDAKELKTFVNAFVSGSDTLRLDVQFPKDGARLEAQLSTRKGTTLHTVVNKLASQKNALYQRLPHKTALVVGLGFSEELNKLMSRAMASLFSLIPKALAGARSPIEMGPYLKAAQQLWNSMTGEVVTAWFTDSKGKPAQGGVFTSKDSSAAGAAMDKLLGLYEDPAFKALMATRRMSVSIKRKAYTLDGMDVTTVQLKRPSMGMFKTGPQITHFAMGKKYGYFAQGNDAKATLAALVKGKPKTPLTKDGGFKRAIAASGEKHLMMIYASPADLLPFILGPMAGMMGGSKPAAGPGSGIAIALSAQGGTLRAMADFPQAQITAIAQTAMRVMSMFTRRRR